ncbi:MAG: S9 family peptidase [Bacteroidales bacterium]|nr:S9 family peptidase [Bacteroidales bacterium]MBN2756219.1 S9 family peptidase [Bacteroidales bacterium]
MNKLLLINGIAIIFLLFACTNNQTKKELPMPPKAEKIKHELTAHGHRRIDNYYWLNERENPKVIDYLNAENAYTKAVMEHTESFQKELFDEIVARIKKDDSSVPYKKNGYFYYTRYEKEGEYPIYCRKKDNMQAVEEILLNVNEMAKEYKYYQVGDLSVSEDNKILAFSVDTVSRRIYTIYFKNLETGELLKDKISVTAGNSTWANDNKTVYYSTKDSETLRVDKIFRHTIGSEQTQDKLIFEEKDETFGTYVYKTKSKKYLVIGSYSTLSTEYQIADANDNNPEFKVFQKRERDLEYDIYHFENKFYVKTNLDAKNFRLMETSENKTTKENWKEIIPNRNDVLLEGVDIFKNYLVLSERKNGLTELRIINQSDKSEYYLNFGEETYTAWTSTNIDFDTEILRYGYTSMTTPNSTFDFNMKSQEKTLLKMQEVLGDFNHENYEAKRLYATATDGTKVPISLVYKKGLKLNGKNPLLLYAYGSYGYSMDPYFSSVRLSLLDRGFVFAIAHIRGGQEMGRYWYEDGKLLKKKNTFTDFIDCSEFLISEKYTNKDNLFAMGGSAGGLLMGAIANMRPDLYKGIVAQVPFVDVMTTMLDESIPLTTGEYDEWGNPNEKEYYDYMLSYSPYDQVKAQNYTNMLVTTGLHDSQVQYFEPAKWVAKLRDMKTDNNLLLLSINMETGHGGASGRFDQYKETALEYAFIFDLLGITK